MNGSHDIGDDSERDYTKKKLDVFTLPCGHNNTANKITIELRSTRKCGIEK